MCGLEIAVDMSADAPECSFVDVGIAPAQVAVEHIACQLVWEQAVRSRLDKRQAAQPGEQVVGIVEFQRVPQESLGRDACERAYLERPALLTVWHDIEEPSQQCGDEIRWPRVEAHIAIRGQVDE